MASIYRCKEAHYFVGFLYHEGKYVKQDINKAIHYYKEASNFYDNYAKNNLGVIYKNGFYDGISPKLGLAIEYFEEAIRQKDDKLSMFNLSSIFMYDERINNDLNRSIDLLIKSSNLNFEPSCILLCLAIIKKCGFYRRNIQKEITKHEDMNQKLQEKILGIIKNRDLCSEKNFNKAFEYFRYVNYLYNFKRGYIFSTDILDKKKLVIPHPPNISSMFYEGFGIDI
ncbi:hypothetical protein M9Y10_024682 [Tritrichomonas musculus]|uniref:Uncharacterized protein n=1 Tax=Tritrichomonas musculus TaxID=1915356 RepID=A0ABR2HAY6_9EUKA